MMAQNTAEDKEISDLDSHETKRSSESVEAISAGGTEDSWESYLKPKLKSVTDKFNEDVKTMGEADEEMCDYVLAVLGQIYDKALKSACLIKATRSEADKIENFFLDKVDNDWKNYEKGLKPWARKECWAAEHKLVNIVVALIRRSGAEDPISPSRGLRALAIAAEDEKDSMIATLTEFAGVDKDFIIEDLNESKEPDSYPPDVYKDHRYLVYTLYPNQEVLLSPIEAAARLGNVNTMRKLIALSKAMKLAKPPDCRRALDWAVKMGHQEVVKFLIDKNHIVDLNNMAPARGLLDEADEEVYGGYQTPLALAVLSRKIEVVKVLCEAKKGGLKADEKTEKQKNALQMAFDTKRPRHRRDQKATPFEPKPGDKIVRILMERREIRREVDRLTEERKVHVDAINAILVGTALIATATFAGWLSPPLGYSPPPGTDGLAFASVEGHPILEKFWVFNSLSFFFSIATFMVGANAARPPKEDDYIGEVVESLRSTLQLAYSLLTIAVAFVIGAFACAGFAVLPPIPKYTVNMAVTVGIGVTVVLLSTMLAMWIKQFTRFKDKAVSKFQRFWNVRWQTVQRQMKFCPRRDNSSSDLERSG